MQLETINTLTYHGRSKDCAQWVIDTFGEAAKKGQYAKNETMQIWIKQSQEILNKAN